MKAKKKPGRPKAGPHIVWRNGRAYADVREFAAVLDTGERSGRIALKVDGQGRATTDPEVAQTLFTRVLGDLRERSRTNVSTGRWKGQPLGTYAAHHLVEKAKSGKNVDRWLQSVERHLREAVAFFGSDTDLAGIKTKDVARYVDHLAQLDNGRSGKLTTASQRKYLNSLSNLYRRAISEGHVNAGANPVAALLDKPVPAEHEAAWLEVPDAALLLEACRTYEPDGTGPAEAMPAAMLHAIVAAFLLTGGRTSEVLGLTVGDVSFERAKVTFRTHPHRRLKTRTSRRSVPLWPQLREILTPYVASLPEDARGPDALLFPSVRGTGMVRDIRKALDAAAARVGWKPGDIRTKMFRHTYCAARLQTATRVLRPGPSGKARVQWIPVSRDEVARELGHGGTSLVARVYGHVGDSRHRSEQPEYRVEQHAEKLAPRLHLIRAA
jgi:integrase